MTFPNTHGLMWRGSHWIQGRSFAGWIREGEQKPKMTRELEDVMSGPRLGGREAVRGTELQAALDKTFLIPGPQEKVSDLRKH